MLLDIFKYTVLQWLDIYESYSEQYVPLGL